MVMVLLVGMKKAAKGHWQQYHKNMKKPLKNG